jgi:hypothetical protein
MRVMKGGEKEMDVRINHSLLAFQDYSELFCGHITSNRQMLRPSGLYSFIFGTSWVQISVRRPSLLTEIFRCFSRLLNANTEIEPETGP